MNIATVIVYYLSCTLLNTNAITLGNVVAFVEYLFHVMMSVLIFCMVFMMYPRANVSAKRILEVLDTKPSIVNDENSIQLESIQTLSFKDVTFSYPNGEEAVLKNIDFVCQKGQKIAVIGSTGSGKSTLVKLMNRFYDVSRGSIEINGVDIRKYNLESLRAQIGYVAQRHICLKEVFNRIFVLVSLRLVLKRWFMQQRLRKLAILFRQESMGMKMKLQRMERIFRVVRNKGYRLLVLS